jgi:hypothetical protein
MFKTIVKKYKAVVTSNPFLYFLIFSNSILRLEKRTTARMRSLWMNSHESLYWTISEIMARDSFLTGKKFLKGRKLVVSFLAEMSSSSWQFK